MLYPLASTAGTARSAKVSDTLQPPPEPFTADQAEQLCDQRGFRFTPLRRLVFDTLARAGHPIGAYGLIDQIEQCLGRRPSPPTVYRALEFLLKQRLISRIESTNAFLLASDPDHCDSQLFLICDRCGGSTALVSSTLSALLGEQASLMGFRVERSIAELQGTCAACRVSD